MASPAANVPQAVIDFKPPAPSVDYGQLYWNPRSRSVHYVAGDADENGPEIHRMLSGISEVQNVEVSDEGNPSGEGWVLVSRNGRPVEKASSSVLTKAQKGTGAMVALYPAPEVAQQLAVPDGEPAADLHITLAYLGEAAEIEDPERLAAVVQGVALSTTPLSGDISGVGHFTAGEEPVTYASPDVPGLSEFRHRVVEALNGAGYELGSEHGFTPHITLAYDHIEPDVPNVPLKFGEVTVCLAGQRQSFPLEGVAKASRLRRAVDSITHRRKTETPEAVWKDEDHRELTVPLWKDDAKRIVYGVVMQPHVPDSQGDWQEPECIEAAAHRYLAESRKHDVQHAEEEVAVVPVESFIAPADMEYAGRPVLKGSWVIAVRVDDPEVWNQVCEGGLTGFSIGGTGTRHE